MKAILLDETSPDGNMRALVEQFQGTVYFYLQSKDGSVRACWVRNLTAAPQDIDKRSMENGYPPLLPAKYCAHPNGFPVISHREALRIVWFEECDAAALLENSEILAVIPGWSGIDGFRGYARDCASKSALCWPIGTQESNAIFERIKNSAQFWQDWQPDHWQKTTVKFHQAIEPVLGSPIHVHDLNFDYWPPRIVLEYNTGQALLFLTIGLCIRAQPKIEMYVEQPELSRRIELAIALDQNDLHPDKQQIIELFKGLADYPWANQTWLGDGHTLPLADMVFGRPGTEFQYLLLKQDPAGAPLLKLPQFRNDPVKLLWLIPIFESEHRLAHSAGVERLEKRLRAAGANWLCRSRQPSVR